MLYLSDVEEKDGPTSYLIGTHTDDELRRMKDEPLPESELQRAKDHLKGSLMLSLENTASRMSLLARQEIYFDRQFGLDETLQGDERVTVDCALLVNGIKQFYKPFWSADGGLTWTASDVASGTPVEVQQRVGESRPAATN